MLVLSSQSFLNQPQSDSGNVDEQQWTTLQSKLTVCSPECLLYMSTLAACQVPQYKSSSYLALPSAQDPSAVAVSEFLKESATPILQQYGLQLVYWTFVNCPIDDDPRYKIIKHRNVRTRHGPGVLTFLITATFQWYSSSSLSKHTKCSSSL